MKILLTVACCLLVLVNPGRATAIILILTPDYVLMGVDSQTNYVDPTTQIRKQKLSTKIFQSSNYFFALSGIKLDSTLSFFPAVIIDHQLKTCPDFASALVEIRKELEPSLDSYIKNLQALSPATLHFITSLSPRVLSVVVIGLVNDQPSAYMLHFNSESINPLVIGVEEHTWIGCQGASYRILGTGNIESIRENAYLIKKGFEPTALMDQLLTLQSEKTPLMVGPPFDIIEIRKAGTTWIRRKEGCPIVLGD